MAIILQKGQVVDLTETDPGLSRIMVGLGWDAVDPSTVPQFDCDVSVLMLDEREKLTHKKWIVYFNNPKSSCNSVQHRGDSRTGEGIGDDEQLFIELKKIPPQIHKLLFAVTIYECQNRLQDFGMIENAFVHIINLVTHTELIRFNLKDESYAGKTALIVGALYRHEHGWKFAAIGEGTNDPSLFHIAKRYT